MGLTLNKASYTFILWHLYVMRLNTSEDDIYALKEDNRDSSVWVPHELGTYSILEDACI